MKTDRFDHRWAEVSREPIMPEHLVAIIDPVVWSIVGKIVNQVANIVKQRGCDQIGIRTIVLGLCRGLQGVFQLRHGLTTVLRISAGLEHFDDGRGGSVHERLRARGIEDNGNSRRGRLLKPEASAHIR